MPVERNHMCMYTHYYIDHSKIPILSQVFELRRKKSKANPVPKLPRQPSSLAMSEKCVRFYFFLFKPCLFQSFFISHYAVQNLQRENSSSNSHPQIFTECLLCAGNRPKHQDVSVMKHKNSCRSCGEFIPSVFIGDNTPRV